MPDQTIYYGEVAFVSKENPDTLYMSLDEIPSEEPVEARERLTYAVRHGYGVQLYGRNPEAGDKLCYYAGKWERDMKTGDGSVLIYPDGVSQYTGSFKNNVFHGQGVLALKCANAEGTVTSKHLYQGGFREGKMEGLGSFEHGLTKQTYGPDFSNNHYLAQNIFSDSFSMTRRSVSPKSIDAAKKDKVPLDLMNLPTKQAKDEFLTRVHKYRKDTAKA